jgi:hypothetical protein
MNLSKDKVTEIFYFADNFCKEFYKAIEIYAIEEGGKARREPRRKPKMSSGEVVTIMVLFHYGAFRNLKHFYLHYVCRVGRREWMCLWFLPLPLPMAPSLFPAPRRRHYIPGAGHR